MNTEKIPSLAGLCSMQRAIEADWSVEESVTRWKRIHFVIKRTYEALVSRITAEPIYELKTAFSHHAYLCGEQVSLIRSRVGEMREPPLGLDKIPHAGLERMMDEIISAPTTVELIRGIYEVAVPAVIDACEKLQQDAHPLADAPSVRAAKLIVFELSDLIQFGLAAIECLSKEGDHTASQVWIDELKQCLSHAGGLDGTQQDRAELPEPRHSKMAIELRSTFRRELTTIFR